MRFALIFLCLLCSVAQAAYPDRPIKIVVPFAPGGGTDLIARGVGQLLSEELGQPVIIDNKAGAGTVIGADFAAKSAPDGYTLLMATFAHAVNPSLLNKLPYDTDKDFAPVILIGRSPNVLVVRADSPYKRVQDIVIAADINPGKLSYASQGNGTSAHLAGELFANLSRSQLLHVPYKGAGPALTDLLGGQVDMMFATASGAAPHLQSGRLRAIAVTTALRSPAALLAKVPTVAEGGIHGYVADSWYGLLAPAGTPPAVIKALHAAVKKAIESDAFRKKVEPEGLVVSTGSPEDLDRHIKTEIIRWRGVVKAANLKAE
jgi:tripartite-type tricarboxylate transporter receptor subunit TctC